MNLNDQSYRKKVIEIRNINKSYSNVSVLKGIDLDLYEGENLVILGRSGSGKTVLIKCIVGLEEPDSGTIHVLGTGIHSLNEFRLNVLRKDIGYLFQSGALYDSMTLKENLLFPLNRGAVSFSEAEKEDLVNEALRNVGLQDAMDKMPSELSGGMKKRAGLARTLVLRPKVILYDEPTTGLDPHTSREISELIMDIKHKYDTSAIIVTHDMMCARITADRIAILKDGEFVGEGSYQELTTKEDNFINSFFTNK